MNQRRFIWIQLFLCGLLCTVARADTFQLADGSTLTGDVVSYNDSGIRLRLADGNYSDPIAWTRFSQDELKTLTKDPKIEPFVSPLIEVTEQQRAQKTEVTITQPTRLKRPTAHSLFGAMLSSPVGMFVIVILYGAGIFAAFEVARFRRRQPGVVCGLAAIPGLGLLSPIIFLAMPPQKLSAEEEEIYQAENAAPVEPPSFIVPGSPEAVAAEAAAANPGGLHIAQAAPAEANPNLPQTQVFQRGAFMFNRRFFETKFPGFFGVVRREADKDLILFIKAGRGEYNAERVTRISANDLHAQVRKGHATEEVMIPFTEIQEVRLKHKDSPN